MHSVQISTSCFLLSTASTLSLGAFNFFLSSLESLFHTSPVYKNDKELLTDKDARSIQQSEG